MEWEVGMRGGDVECLWALLGNQYHPRITQAQMTLTNPSSLSLPTVKWAHNTSSLCGFLYMNLSDIKKEAWFP